MLAAIYNGSQELKTADKTEEFAMKKRRKENKGSIVKTVAIAAAFAVTLGGGIFLGNLGGSLKNAASAAVVPDVHSEKTLDVVTIESVIEPAAELVTLKYNYTDVATFEDHTYASLFGKEVSVGTDKSIFKYKGTACVGIDFSEVKVGVDNAAKKIYVFLPEVHIISNAVDHDSVEVLDAKDSVFVKSDIGDYMDLLDEEEREKESELLEDETLHDNVITNAQSIIRDFLHNADSTQEYDVEFTDDISLVTE